MSFKTNHFVVSFCVMRPGATRPSFGHAYLELPQKVSALPKRELLEILEDVERKSGGEKAVALSISPLEPI